MPSLPPPDLRGMRRGLVVVSFPAQMQEKERFPEHSGSDETPSPLALLA